MLRDELCRGARNKKEDFDLGISPDRFSTISYGEELPLCKEQPRALCRQGCSHYIDLWRTGDGSREEWAFKTYFAAEPSQR